MSVHLIYYQQGHKMMEAVATEEAYRRYRDSQAQQRWVETIRHPQPETDVSAAKRKLVQFNYSCLPTEDGCLKGAKRLSKSRKTYQSSKTGTGTEWFDHYWRR